MRKSATFLSIIVLAFILTQNCFAQFPIQQQYIYNQPQYIGIPSTMMNFSAAAQDNSQWCWAASIQTVFTYYGISITQEQIVARTYGTDPYGNLPNLGGSLQTITTNLNNWNIDNSGRQYVVMATINQGVPVLVELLQELGQGRPVIVAYRSGMNSSHAVVITGASYTNSPNGLIVHTIVARDPWPSPNNIETSGRVEYPAGQFLSLIHAYWYIRIQ